MTKLNMKKLSGIKVVQTQPLVVCLIWNTIVLAAALGMVIHEDSYYWIALCVLVAWPNDYE